MTSDHAPGSVNISWHVYTPVSSSLAVTIIVGIGMAGMLKSQMIFALLTGAPETSVTRSEKAVLLPAANGSGLAASASVYNPACCVAPTRVGGRSGATASVSASAPIPSVARIPNTTISPNRRGEIRRCAEAFCSAVFVVPARTLTMLSPAWHLCWISASHHHTASLPRDVVRKDAAA